MLVCVCVREIPFNPSCIATATRVFPLSQPPVEGSCGYECISVALCYPDPCFTFHIQANRWCFGLGFGFRTRAMAYNFWVVGTGNWASNASLNMFSATISQRSRKVHFLGSVEKRSSAQPWTGHAYFIIYFGCLYMTHTKTSLLATSAQLSTSKRNPGERFRN